MAVSANPTFVFVPGAWHKSDVFQEVAASLAERGYYSKLVTLASVGADPPLTGFEKDVRAVEKIVRELIDAGKDVILVMHSYGGIPGCQAMEPIMNDNEGGMEKGKVIRLVWITGFVPLKGRCLQKAVGGDLSWWIIEDTPHGMIVNPDDQAYRFYADLPPEKATYWASNLKPQSYACFHSVVTVEPWLNIPSSYLLCENDNAIPINAQDGMVKNVQEKSGGKAFDHVETCESGHSPFLSMPGMVVEFLERAVEKGVKKDGSFAETLRGRR